MDNIDNIKKEVLANSPENFSSLVNDAIAFAQESHKGESRKSGEDFIIHPLNTALTVSRIGLDTDTIIASLLHSLAHKEDKMEDIKQIFGEDVYNLIRQTRKIHDATKNSKTPDEVITKYILNRSKDIRPIIIKLASALHNVQTIEHLPNEELKDTLRKIFNIYANLAEYLNFNTIKKELEEHAFKVYQPLEYESITEKMKSLNINDELLNKYREIITTQVTDIPVKVDGRIKGKYSIYNKLKKYEKEWKDPNIGSITDMIAFRVITKTIDDCFLVLERIMDNAELNTELFVDYISNPKPNGYQAIHSVIKFPQIADLEFEVQILTEVMHYTNTYGKASHIAYKASQSRFAQPTDVYSWVEDVHNKIESHISRREFERSIPIECNIFENEVYAFTPKGEIILLSNGDTALDFAFKVHTQVGDSAIGAKINGIAGKLDTVLKTDDVVEIKTQKDKKCQNESALKIVNSSSSRTKILQGLCKKNRN
ncbi:MAG: RelA/SpoT family protein [candidate division WS6 bacterium GW2011_GWF1_35_23]|uniref:RelA/SpoT family protein n=1 Tax=candidate division WS6 bacterium GW2011_GWF1_35_23 TaxID=1619097 RepID=A0A0G0BZC3_9BACT|nr:MAG: RelA/SpoT family protein [candidate division WS6 bacterium GW2011_GWF1_35_23]